MTKAETASLGLSIGAVLVSLATLWIARRQLIHAQEESRRDSRQRRIDALASLMLSLRRFHDVATGSLEEPEERVRSEVLIAVARASDALPADSVQRLRTVLGVDLLWSGPAAKESVGLVLEALADETRLPWLADPGDELELVIAFLGLSDKLGDKPFGRD